MAKKVRMSDSTLYTGFFVMIMKAALKNATNDKNQKAYSVSIMMLRLKALLSERYLILFFYLKRFCCDNASCLF